MSRARPGSDARVLPPCGGEDCGCGAVRGLLVLVTGVGREGGRGCWASRGFGSLRLGLGHGKGGEAEAPWATPGLWEAATKMGRAGVWLCVPRVGFQSLGSPQEVPAGW